MAAYDSIFRVESAVAAAGHSLRERGQDTYRTQGVCHGGRSSESLVFFYDPERGHSNPYCHAGCERNTILDVLGLTEAALFDEPLKPGTGDLWTPRPPAPPRIKPEPVIFEPSDRGWRPPALKTVRCYFQDEGGNDVVEMHQLVSEYLYADEDWRIVFGVVRCDHKHFWQWRPDRAARGFRRWAINEYDKQTKDLIGTVRTVPYMLPQLLSGIAEERTIWVSEGEKDARRLVAEGVVATCNAGGAGGWNAKHAAFLKGADVRIVADRDEAGRKHAMKVVDTLMSVARSIEVVQSAHLKDASDHFDAGGTLADFIPAWDPKPLIIEEAS